MRREQRAGTVKQLELLRHGAGVALSRRKVSHHASERELGLRRERLGKAAEIEERHPEARHARVHLDVHGHRRSAGEAHLLGQALELVPP
jgi:hypothetical protein